jgi:23S rRNA-/tRNA-specific pseudouridylate synthase
MKDRMQMAVLLIEIGKPAITHYQVLERFGYVTLISCQLETGRTHQIRAHLKHPSLFLMTTLWRSLDFKDYVYKIQAVY